MNEASSSDSIEKPSVITILETGVQECDELKKILD